jgi:hypothetical protein
MADAQRNGADVGHCFSTGGARYPTAQRLAQFMVAERLRLEQTIVARCDPFWGFYTIAYKFSGKYEMAPWWNVEPRRRLCRGFGTCRVYRANLTEGLERLS